MSDPRRSRQLSIVLAQRCPHCVPLSVKNGQRRAWELGIPFRTLDTDRKDQGREADRYVRPYGDAAPDYLIPQVFRELSDGPVQCLLTGFSEQVSRTSGAWRSPLSSA
jgi:hypothetical protein